MYAIAQEVVAASGLPKDMHIGIHCQQHRIKHCIFALLSRAVAFISHIYPDLVKAHILDICQRGHDEPDSGT